MKTTETTTRMKIKNLKGAGEASPHPKIEKLFTVIAVMLIATGMLFAFATVHMVLGWFPL